MRLSKILSNCNYECLKGDVESDICHVTHDSRQVVEKSLFIAIKGYTQDGHHYIPSAIAKGASAIIVSDRAVGLAIEKDIAIVYMEKPATALAQIGIDFYEHPSSNLNMIGVTGTNGKTSIAQIINGMLKKQDRRTAVFGTIGNTIGEELIPTTNTTPDGLVLNSLLRRALDYGATDCIMEVSSHALALGRVAGIAFDIGIFTNLSEDHLDFHKDFEDYFESKALLFNALQKGAVINADDPYGMRLIERFNKYEYTGQCLSYSIEGDTDLVAKQIVYDPKGTHMVLKTPIGQANVFFPIPGKIYVYNILACVGAMVLLGYDFDTILSAISTIEPVRGRLENVQINQPYHVMVDYAHTPDALKNVLEVVGGCKDNRVISVFSCGGDRDKTKRPLMAKMAEKYSDIVIVTSDNPRTEDPESIIDDIFKGFENPDVINRISDRKQAIESAINRAEQGDIILIAGKGHEDYQIIGREKIHFDDREVVETYIRERNRKL